MKDSLEQNPSNIRICATSSQRYLVEEHFSEREDAVNARVIMWERHHINTSGRTAEQLVHYLLGEQKRQEFSK